MTPLTTDDVVAVTGRLDDICLAEIIATGATPAELLQAKVWLDGDDPYEGEPALTRHDVVAQVYRLLKGELKEWDDEPS